MQLGTDKQPYYKQGRELETIMLSDIEGICDCGYLTLSPTNSFENHNGGLTIKRNNVTILNDETGQKVKRLSRKNINSYSTCNACANDWR